MIAPISNFLAMISGDGRRNKVVPPTGFTATLSTATSAIMAFLVVFALVLSLAADRLAARWSTALSGSATLRVSASADQLEAQVQQALQVLQTTNGIASARVMSADEQRALLEPWFGPDMPLEDLAVPRLIDIQETSAGYDAQGLRLRLAAEVPSAVLDDHTRWQKPLARAAQRLWLLGIVSIILMIAANAAMITLAARASMAANAQVIAVLRLIGATDNYIASAFVGRFTFRAFAGASIGIALGAVVVYLIPAEEPRSLILTGLGLQGLEWLWLVSIPPFSAGTAYLSTRRAAQQVLAGLA